jgi:3-isopropylmalate dehydratase small subunit
MTQNEVEMSQKGSSFPDLNPVWKEVVHNGDDQIQSIFQYQKHQGTKLAPLKMHYLWHNLYLFFSTRICN